MEDYFSTKVFTHAMEALNYEKSEMNNGLNIQPIMISQKSKFIWHTISDKMFVHTLLQMFTQFCLGLWYKDLVI